MSRHQRVLIAASAALLAATASLPAVAETDAAAPATAAAQAKGSSGLADAFDSRQPVDITAAEANLDQTDHTLLLKGDVIAKQGPVELKADNLTVYYLDNKDAGTTVGSRIKKMVAKGNVVVTRPGEIVRSRDATYDLPSKRILMSGDVVATRKGSVVRGQRVVVDLAKETIELQSTASGERVRALFNPPSKNEAKP
jgi:lipopolysaccharide export system protein LptA